jgi:hypothetical protein
MHSGPLSADTLPAALRDYATIRNNHAIRIEKDGHTAAAVALIRRAIMSNPLDDKYRINLASYLIWTGELEEGRALVESVLKRDPEMSSAWCCMATLSLIEGNHDRTVSCCERALALDPNHPQKTFDLACSYLRAGDFERGWPMWEKRHMTQEPYTPPPVPRWNGEKAKHLFLWTEQGIGDKIQFSRYIPLLQEYADKITLAIDRESMPLFFGFEPSGDANKFRMIVPDDSNIPSDIDYQFPLMSAPVFFKTDASNIPPDPARLPLTGTRGMVIADGLKIGVVWAGSKLHANDRVRSMPFTEMLPLGADRRNDLFALQVAPRSGDVIANSAQLLVSLDLVAAMEGNWFAVPTIVNQMDLIVTVDTAVAHIAGSLGRPCFLLLSKFNDWRWMLKRDDTPWYPSIRIFRQDKFGDWKGVIRRVQMAINEIHVKRLEVIQQARAATPPSAEAAA